MFVRTTVPGSTFNLAHVIEIEVLPVNATQSVVRSRMVDGSTTDVGIFEQAEAQAVFENILANTGSLSPPGTVVP